MRRTILCLMALVMGCQIVTAQKTAIERGLSDARIDSAEREQARPKVKSIVILYENDAHCGIDGYTKIAGLRDAINHTDTAYAAAVCCGDFLQGNTTGAISKGQYIADILRLMD